jgi:hypothetical protein
MAAHWNGFSLGHAVFSSIAVATRFTSAKAYFREIHRYISENITTMSEKRQKGKAGLHRKKSIAGHSDTLPFAARAAA